PPACSRSARSRRGTRSPSRGTSPRSPSVEKFADDAVEEGGVLGALAGRGEMALQRRNLDEARARDRGRGGARRSGRVEQVERRREQERARLDASERCIGVAGETRRRADVVALVGPGL